MLFENTLKMSHNFFPNFSIFFLFVSVFLGLILQFSRFIFQDELFGQYWFLKAKCNVILPERVCPPFRR